MKKEDAKKLLKEKIGKLDSNSFDHKVWTSETNALLERIFIHKAEEKKKNLRAISYDVFNLTGRVTESEKRKHLNEAKSKARRFLNSYIEEIDKIGIPIEKKSLNISILRTKTFWTVAIATIGAVFSLGRYIGNVKFDQDKLEMYDRNHALLDRLDSVNSAFIQYKDSVKINKDTIDVK